MYMTSCISTLQVAINALATANVIQLYRGGDNEYDDIRMKPTTGTQCHILLRKLAGVLLCVTPYIDEV